MKKKFNEFKEEVKTKVEEMKSKKEDQEMAEEKKGMPKWLKITLAGVAGTGLAAGAYMLGKHNGNSDDSDYVSDFQDEMMEDDDLDSEEF